MTPRLRSLIGIVVTVALAAVVVGGLVSGDPSPEDRAYALGLRIKCPVCQGSAIGDSPSETAQTMMQIVREKVAAGESDAQIEQYFVDRYGDWVLLDPPASGKTLVLWLVPVVFLIGGIVMILRRRRTVDDGEPSGVEAR